MNNYKNFNSIYDDVDEEDQLADKLLKSFDTKCKTVQNDLWKKFTVSSTLRTCGTPDSVRLLDELVEEGYYARALSRKFAISSTRRPYDWVAPLPRSYLKQYLFLTTIKYVSTDTEQGSQFLDYINISFWKSFAAEFVCCLDLEMPTRFQHFQLNPLPNGLFRLSNVTCNQNDFSAVTGLLKAFYDIALWRISTIKRPDQQQRCFHTLNKFFCSIQMENLHQLKLQAVACHRARLSFNSAFVPQYQIDLHILKETHCAENICNQPEYVYIKFDDQTSIHSSIPLDLNFNENDYFEEGCFEFFVSRMKQRTNFYRENDIMAQSPIISEDDFTLTFPDGTVFSYNATNLLCTIQKYYKCQLLEILAIKNRKSRLCFLTMFNTNMDLFITDSVRRIQNYFMDIDELLAFQSMTRLQNNFIKAYAAKYESGFVKKQRFQSTALEFSSEISYKGTSPIFEVEQLAAHAVQQSSMQGVEEKINLQAIRNHIIQGVCVIIGVSFCLSVFMCFFTIWLCYMSNTARLKQEQEKIELLRCIRSEDCPAI